MQRRLASVAIALALGMTLQACGRSTSEAEVPDAPEPPPVSAADKALIDATPQQSLSAEDRADFRELARGYIDSVEDKLAVGYTADPSVRDAVAAMQPTQTHDWKLSLKRGVAYRMIGGCDNECTDMDLLLLLDAAGKIIERDTLPDSAPVLNVTPSADADYTVRLEMKTCTIAPCYASARLYTRTGPTERTAEAPPSSV